MSLAEDIMAEVGALRRAVHDQTTLITGFLRTNRDAMDMVRQGLAGSRNGYDQEMLAILNQTEESLTSSAADLQRAATALERVENSI